MHGLNQEQEKKKREKALNQTKIDLFRLFNGQI